MCSFCCFVTIEVVRIVAKLFGTLSEDEEYDAWIPPKNSYEKTSDLGFNADFGRS